MASQLNAIDAGHACFRQMYIRPQVSSIHEAKPPTSPKRLSTTR
ncbi:hypothetical protein SNOG_11428 [Parastagonospora nodorum SN15]|uniref:Uncharacterized protein n=1 Tax=Phaeosphaeria nodorum (strain SN15 / ATCC MYA-4574 / FGSC 10173) TaxID=321614 RepID=Q0U9Y6_PHANO|nr:hypothetical protein SNOG_11428 [Parastagonospora nodorum SN15]EAT81136.1 hypothetical protein SNOG_11428 [Parastagonospora nodorum SN15]